jgi:hypothetical protein
MPAPRLNIASFRQHPISASNAVAVKRPLEARADAGGSGRDP